MQFSWLLFFGLVVLAVCTFAMTEFLSSRYTIWRRYFVLRDFASAHGLKLAAKGSLDDALPPRLTTLAPRARWHFTDGTVSTIRLQSGQETFNLVVMKIAGAWPATALRPTSQSLSLLDKLDLFSYPSPYGTLRFTLHGLDAAAARRLSDSRCRALLPADLGLLVENGTMTIDFSSRPFDPIELDRIIALARQLVGALPAIPLNT